MKKRLATVPLRMSHFRRAVERMAVLRFASRPGVTATPAEPEFAMRYLLGFVCVLALGVTGCSEAVGVDGDGGSGGIADSGGIAGSGGIGAAGSGGQPIVECLGTEDHCVNGAIEPHEPCCEQEVPDQANACDGTESTENPTTCTANGSAVTHRLTIMEVEDDCNVGYNLDACEGQSCLPFGLTPAEGMSGVDNALAGLAPIYANVGGNFATLNKAFSDALCGMTGGLDGGTCAEIPTTEIRFVIDANPSEGCANVTVLADGEASAHILNLSDDGCASGELGTIPVPMIWLGEGSLENTVVRMTVSSAGFSHGQLGATMDADTAWTVLAYVAESAVAIYPFDVNASSPPTIDPTAACNGLSAAFVIGGIAE